MRPIGFVKCYVKYFSVFTQNKVYPFYQINNNCGIDGAAEVEMMDDNGISPSFWFVSTKIHARGASLVLYHYPEFPKDVTKWTEDDWFQYDLKYGE